MHQSLYTSCVQKKNIFCVLVLWLKILNFNSFLKWPVPLQNPKYTTLLMVDDVSWQDPGHGRQGDPTAVTPHPFYTRLRLHQSTDHITLGYTRTHPFNGPFSRTTQKSKTNLDFTEARDSEWQWNQLGRVQVCTSLQTDNHASTPPLSFLQVDALSATQPTMSEHWRHSKVVHVVPEKGLLNGCLSSLL